MRSIFMKFGTQNKSNKLIMNIALGIWWSCPKIIDSGKLGPNTEICSDFYEIWHSRQIDCANYEYRDLAWLLAQNDYR